MKIKCQFLKESIRKKKKINSGKGEEVKITTDPRRKAADNTNQWPTHARKEVKKNEKCRKSKIKPGKDIKTSVQNKEDSITNSQN